MKIKKPHVAVQIILGIVSVLLCIALFCTTVLTIVVADLKMLTGKDALKTVITQLLFTAPKSGPVYPLQAVGAGGVRLDDTAATVPADLMDQLGGGDGESTQLIVEYVYSWLKEEAGENLTVTKEEVGELLEQSTVPEFVSEKFSSVLSDVITGESTTVITAEEIQTLVEENKGLIEQVTGETLPQEVINQIVTVVEETDVVTTLKDTIEVQLGLKPDPNSPSDEDAGFTATPTGGVLQGILSGNVSITNGGLATILAAIREITSTTVLMTMLGVCLALIALLFAANYWKLHAALRGAGISLMLAALPFALASAAVTVTPALFAATTMKVVASVITAVSAVSFGTFFGGLAMLVGSIVWGSLRAKKLRKMAQPVTVPEAEPVIEPLEIHPVVDEEAPALDIQEDEI